MNRLSLLVLLSVIFVSCGNLYEDEKISHVEQKKYPTLTASFADNETRTYIDQNLIQHWYYSDSIYAFLGNSQRVVYTFNGETGDTSGEFVFWYTRDDEPGVSLDRNYAVYPGSADVSILEDGVINYWFRIGQFKYSDVIAVDSDDNTMVAVTKNAEDTDLSFKNVCGYLKLKLYGDATISSIELMGNNDERINGKAVISVKYGEEPQTIMVDDDEQYESRNIISLWCINDILLSSDVNNPTEFWFVVPPTTFEKGITIVVTDSNGDQFVKTTDKTVIIKRNEIQPMAKLNFNEDFKSVADMEREALISFYNALDGDNWINNVNWCSDKPVGEWYGVSVDSNGCVTGLRLEQNSLKGDVPSDIADLLYLTSLDIDSNEIYRIPNEIATMRMLRYLDLPAVLELPLDDILNNERIGSLCLDLRNVRLNGYEFEINKLKWLTGIDVRVNKDDLVELPKDFSRSYNLSSLRLTGFAGTIDDSIGECGYLWYLSIQDGNVSGEIPSTIGNLSLLRHLDLSKNQLSGSIPSEICKLSLEHLDLSQNKLEGNLPVEFIKLLDTIRWVDNSCGLNHNMLSGGISEEMQKHPNWCRAWPYIIFDNDYDRAEYRLPGPRLAGFDVYGEAVDSTEEYTSAKYTLIYQMPVGYALSHSTMYNYYDMLELYNKYDDINILQICAEWDSNANAVTLIEENNVPWRVFTAGPGEIYSLILNDGDTECYIDYSFDGNNIGNQVTVVNHEGNVVFIGELDGRYNGLCKFLADSYADDTRENTAKNKMNR